MNKRSEIKAIPYLAKIREWALNNRMPFFFWKDMRKAIGQYEFSNQNV